MAEKYFQLYKLFGGDISDDEDESKMEKIEKIFIKKRNCSYEIQEKVPEMLQKLTMKANESKPNEPTNSKKTKREKKVERV